MLPCPQMWKNSILVVHDEHSHFQNFHSPWGLKPVPARFCPYFFSSLWGCSWWWDKHWGEGGLVHGPRLSSASQCPLLDKPLLALVINTFLYLHFQSPLLLRSVDTEHSAFPLTLEFLPCSCMCPFYSAENFWVCTFSKLKCKVSRGPHLFWISSPAITTLYLGAWLDEGGSPQRSQTMVPSTLEVPPLFFWFVYCSSPSWTPRLS